LNNQTKSGKKDMKQLSILMKLGILFSVTLYLEGCAGTGSMNAAASPQKEQLLTQAGFVVKTATTPKQQQQLAALPGNHVSAVKYKGKLYYAYPAGAGNKVYVGRQAQYNTYKQLLAAQKAKMASANAAAAAQPTFVEETAGPNHIMIEEFDGFGPLGMDTGGF
jgi:hypothetical protein